MCLHHISHVTPPGYCFTIALTQNLKLIKSLNYIQQNIASTKHRHIFIDFVLFDAQLLGLLHFMNKASMSYCSFANQCFAVILHIFGHCTWWIRVTFVSYTSLLVVPRDHSEYRFTKVS